MCLNNVYKQSPHGPHHIRQVSLNHNAPLFITVCKRSYRKVMSSQVSVPEGVVGLYPPPGPYAPQGHASPSQQSCNINYRSGTVNSKSFVGKVLLRIKWKFELTVYFKHGILGK